MSMRKGFALVLVLVFLMSSLVIMTNPVLATSTENTWVTKSSMPSTRLPGYLVGTQTAVVDGKIYVMGCYLMDGSAGNYLYDPATDNWTAKTPMPTPRMYFGIAAYQNKIYTIGGVNINGTSFSVNEVYDPLNDTWETKQPMPISAAFPGANVVDGEIYVMTGSKNEVYDIANDSWSTCTPMPYPVDGFASTVLDNRIYVFGGHSSNTVSDQTQIYDPLNDSWSFGAPLLTAVSGAAPGLQRE